MSRLPHPCRAVCEWLGRHHLWPDHYFDDEHAGTRGQGRTKSHINVRGQHGREGHGFSRAEPALLLILALRANDHLVELKLPLTLHPGTA